METTETENQDPRPAAYAARYTAALMASIPWLMESASSEEDVRNAFSVTWIGLENAGCVAENLYPGARHASARAYMAVIDKALQEHPRLEPGRPGFHALADMIQDDSAYVITDPVQEQIEDSGRMVYPHEVRAWHKIIGVKGGAIAVILGLPPEALGLRGYGLPPEISFFRRTW